MHIYMGVSVLLLHSQLPATRKGCDTNATIKTKLFQISFLIEYQLFYIKKEK